MGGLKPVVSGGPVFAKSSKKGGNRKGALRERGRSGKTSTNKQPKRKAKRPSASLYLQKRNEMKTELEDKVEKKK